MVINLGGFTSGTLRGLRQWEYRPELDGLRAVAVLAVFASHTGYDIGPGYLGVNVFFVLSGYLITSLLLAERENRQRVDYRAFYIRRGLRLYPALLAACVLVAIFGTIVTLQSHQRAILEIGAALTYTTDFAVAAHNTHIWGSWLGHTWSLAVEEQFYLVWPVALMALAASGRLRKRLAALAGVLVFVPVAAGLLLGAYAVQYSPLGAGFQLVAGALLAVVPLRVPRWAWLGVIAGYAFVWVTTPDPRNVALQYGPMQIFTLAAVILVAWALTHRPRALACRPAVWLGRRSYGFYLYHLPVIILLEHRMASRSNAVALSLVVALAITAASYRWIEQPFLSLKRRFARVRTSART